MSPPACATQCWTGRTGSLRHCLGPDQPRAPGSAKLAAIMSPETLSFLDGRITLNPDLCNGRPTIRGLRITVETVLGFLSAGESQRRDPAPVPFLGARGYRRLPALRRRQCSRTGIRSSASPDGAFSHRRQSALSVSRSGRSTSVSTCVISASTGATPIRGSHRGD